MCGLLGFVLHDGAAPLDPGQVAHARDRMTHRGPDDAGLVVLDGGRVVLAHRRLAIQDLSRAGRQPMAHPRRDLWLTYNGEVYNFLELRARLEERGEALRSRTDTEVVLMLYAEMGLDFVHALRGMFAFGLWDGERRRLVLVRDRAGIKPLYYSLTERGLGFASSIEPLLAAGWIRPRLREEAVPEYLALGRVGAPDTLLDGVSKLAPGHMLVVDDGRAPRLVRYDEPQWTEDADPQSLPGRLAHRLRESVALRLISDVPVGVTLSGGVDSSLVAGLIAENGSVPLRTFTVAFRGEDRINEAEHARGIARHLKAEHHEVWLDAKDVRDALPEIERFVDEPHPNPIWLATYFVCRLAKENGVTVVLTGDGGDELFFGYYRWLDLLRAYRRWLRPMSALPGPLRGAALGAVQGLVRNQAVRELFRRAARREPVYWGPMFFYPEAMERLLSERGREVLRAHPPAGRLMGCEQPKDFWQWVRRVGLQGHLVEDFLARLDRMGMAVSVEGRTPLLDQEVVRLAAAYPFAMLMRGGKGKAPLRDLVETLYPRALVDRAKLGFGAPTVSWIRGGLFDVARDALTGFAEEVGLFDRAALESMLRRPPTDTRSAQRLWALASLARWWERMRAHAPRAAPVR